MKNVSPESALVCVGWYSRMRSTLDLAHHLVERDVDPQRANLAGRQVVLGHVGHVDQLAAGAHTVEIADVSADKHKLQCGGVAFDRHLLELWVGIEHLLVQ